MIYISTYIHILAHRFKLFLAPSNCTKMDVISLACPCGRCLPPPKSKPRHKPMPLPYTDCCGRYIDHFDTTPAPDAESLMRSRYTAFVRGKADYLRATWHPSTCPTAITLDAQAHWLGLEVRGHWPGIGLKINHAEVEFVARYREAGGAVRLHERSYFVREETATPLPRWFYVSGALKGDF